MRPISSVRGIGLAVRVSTSTPIGSFFIASLWETPKRCSSSTTSRPRSLERDVLGEQAVRADDDVDDAVGEPATTARASAGGEEAREHLDPDRVGGEAVGEGLEVLLGEQRRRHEHGGLLAVLDRLEDRPHRDLGLAEADVAADEPVHRHGRVPCRP